MINELSLLLESASFSVYGWLITALFLLLFEVLNPGLFFFLSFSAGSFFSAVTAWNEFPLVVQCLTFIVVSLITFFVLRWYFKPQAPSSESRTGVDAHMGKEDKVFANIS